MEYLKTLVLFRGSLLLSTRQGDAVGFTKRNLSRLLIIISFALPQYSVGIPHDCQSKGHDNYNAGADPVARRISPLQHKPLRGEVGEPFGLIQPKKMPKQNYSPWASFLLQISSAQHDEYQSGSWCQ